MKTKILVFFLSLSLVLTWPLASMAIVASTGSTGSTGTSSGTSGKSSSKTDVNVQCKNCDENRFPMGAGGGRSPDKNASGAAEMAKTNKASEEAAQKVAEKAEEAANKEDEDLARMLKDCITGINGNIFTGNFGDILDQILGAIMTAACNFARQKSQQYLSAAIDALTFDLPNGMGTIGANTTILGYTGSTVSASGTLNDVGKDGSTSPVAGNQANAGYTMFKNGGSILLDQSGTLKETGTSFGSIF